MKFKKVFVFMNSTDQIAGRQSDLDFQYRL